MKIGEAQRHWIPAFAGMTILFFFRLGWAEPTITARVSSTDVSVDNSITLSIEISGISNINGAPDLNLPDFQVAHAGQTQSYQWVNGQSSSLITFNYVLTPTKTGNLSIPSITLQSDGKSYSTQPIAIVVSGAASGGSTAGNAGSVNPSGGNAARSGSTPSEGLKPVFMTASVDKSKVYVGEQVLLTVQFLRRPNIPLASQPRYREPDMTGFLVEPIKQQEYTSNLNGVPYVITELRYGLFPTSDGGFTVGNAGIDVAIRSAWDPFDSNSIFENFFNQGQVVKLTTRAIPIQVRALPNSKPTGFSGSVGRFKLSAKVDTSEPEVGKPFNLILKVEGVGNIKSIREPVIPELKSFRRYETISSSKINNEGKYINGSKEFKILMIPQVSGTLTIPPVSFSYFNSEEHQYKTESTGAIPLNVKGGTLASANTERPTVNPPNQPVEGIHVVEQDIRYIKTGNIHPAERPLSTNAGFWILNTLPPIFAAAAALLAFRSKRRRQRMGFYRSKEALSKAKKGLRQAKKLLNHSDSNIFFGKLTLVLSGFLADKLGVSSSGMIWNEIEEQLKEKGADARLRSEARAIWDESDLARFGIKNFSPEEKLEHWKKTEHILVNLDKIL